MYTIYNSFLFKSNGAFLLFFKNIPNVILNQHLEKLIKPITFAVKNKNTVSTGKMLNKLLNK